jgi:hypothetical protein
MTDLRWRAINAAFEAKEAFDRIECDDSEFGAAMAANHAAHLAHTLEDLKFPEVKKMTERCFWCNTDPDEAAARHEGPHATWCLRYRRGEGVADPSEPCTTRVEVEMSLSWCVQHPDLYIRAVREFDEKYPAPTWARRVDTSRTGFIVLVGERK